MKSHEKVQEIRKTLKNINNDDEIDKIHDILDELDNQNLIGMVPGEVEPIIKNGILTQTELSYEHGHHPLGTSSSNGIAVLRLTIEADTNHMK